MLRSLDSILGWAIIATDGEIGKAYNIYFDDRSWAVRYLVVETGSWFMRRRVLISPAVLGIPDRTAKTIPVLLTKDQVRNSPDVDTDRPVSRQQELALIRHYGWTDYLNLEPLPAGAWTVAPAFAPEAEAGDPHLRNAREVAGYRADALDGPFGAITDFIIDDELWGIVGLVVSPDFPPDDRKVVIPAQRVSTISWDGRGAQLSQSRERLLMAHSLIEA